MRSRSACVLLIVSTLTACRTLPDVGPFVDTTHELRSAVTQSGSTTVSALETIGAEAQARKLEKAWKLRNRAFDAIAAYADSLQAIMAAGNQGAQAAASLIQSVEGLAEASGIPIRPAPASIAVASDAISLILRHISQGRAARTLQEAMETAQPAVEAIVELSLADLSAIDDVFRAANESTRSDVQVAYSDRLGYRKSLEDLLTRASVAGADGATLERLTLISRLLAETEAWHGDYTGALDQIGERLRTGRALLAATQASARTWVEAHRQLVVALQTRQPVSIGSLVTMAEEIQILVRRMREP